MELIGVFGNASCCDFGVVGQGNRVMAEILDIVSKRRMYAVVAVCSFWIADIDRTFGMKNHERAHKISNLYCTRVL